MKKVLITGANGLLGQALINTLPESYEIFSSDIAVKPAIEFPGRSDSKTFHYIGLDITDAKKCKELIKQIKPDIILNAAAFTDVDGCEVEKELCWKVNVKGVENLAAAARLNMALLVHISTDYIFDGETGPYSEDDKPNPLGYYGKAKLASENTVRVAGIPYAIIRTNVLYGVGVNVKNNFFLWVYNNLKAGKQINVVTDQYNNPTLAEELAEGIKLLIKTSKYGVFHIAGKEYLNRFDFAGKVAEVFGFSPGQIHPITSEKLNQKSPRPMKGGLNIERAKEEFNYRPKPLSDVLRYLKRKIEAAS